MQGQAVDSQCEAHAGEPMRLLPRKSIGFGWMGGQEGWMDGQIGCALCSELGSDLLLCLWPSSDGLEMVLFGWIEGFNRCRDLLLLHKW